ncbi:MAG: DNA polymerase IV [Candidatus Liptonbacteria bacterium]|nr:DNA polymerase IV [Candidatus Liptonbacteria bacterium]
MKRIIAHLDMDAFFAAIEERDKPRLKGLPIVVGADPEEGKGRGVVSTANYKAREYGIHSAMPISTAWRRSEAARQKGRPPAVFLGGNFARYGEVSERIMAIIRTCVARVEAASVDEAYMDLSFSDSYEGARAICESIKQEIREKEKLTASIGMGPNKLVAKIASDFKKPDGLTIVGHDDEKTCAELVEAFLEPLPIRKIPGIGPKTEAMFSEKGVSTIRDLTRFSQTELGEMLGKWGLSLYRKARGVDESPIVQEYERKSIGEQETFREDTKDSNFIQERLAAMCESVIAHLTTSEWKSFRGVSITVRFADFETKTRAHTFRDPVSDLGALQFEAMRLVMPFLDKRENLKKKKIRLIGVRVEKLGEMRRARR